MARVPGESWYDTAQICRNGHLVSAYYESQPEHRQAFCDKCGAPTIIACEACETAIRGAYHVPRVLGFLGPTSPPAYCHACGQPYPWTEDAMAAVRELADEQNVLTAEEREQLKATLPDLVASTPRTTLAAGRFKRLVATAGSGAADAFHDLLVDVLSEAAKKAIWGPGA